MQRVVGAESQGLKALQDVWVMTKTVQGHIEGCAYFKSLKVSNPFGVTL